MLAMEFTWLKMRITEEQDRREREALVLKSLPRALDELHRSLAACITAYTSAFGPETAEEQLVGSKIRITVREELEGKWQQRVRMEVIPAPTLPGFRIERGGAEPLLIEVGMLQGDKLFYKDQDQYLTMEELTRRVLDRAFFPKLGD
jgi:hypothetical protein